MADEETGLSGAAELPGEGSGEGLSILDRLSGKRPDAQEEQDNVTGEEEINLDTDDLGGEDTKSWWSELGYGSEEEARKGFSNLQKGDRSAKQTITKQGQKISELEDRLNFVVQKFGDPGHKPEQTAQEPAGAVVDDDVFDELARNPSMTIEKIVDKRLAAPEEVERGFEPFRDGVYDEVNTELANDGFTMEGASEEEQAAFDEVMKYPLIERNIKFLTKDNYRTFNKEQVKEFMRDTLKLAVLAARGVNANKKINDATVVAKREAKADQIRKQGAGNIH